MEGISAARLVFLMPARHRRLAEDHCGVRPSSGLAARPRTCFFMARLV